MTILRIFPRKWGYIFILTFSLLSLLFSSSCRLYRLQKKLNPDDADFLSKVRYIITRQEEKIFLELPESERPNFKEEFWKRRDPDPDTEENEFRMEYFNRIEETNNLFQGEGKPGWLTDRGRIYILFGPPTDRITNPMGEGPYGRCNEIWYYGGFPVVFVDYNCSGDYKLVTYDLTEIRSLNLMYMHELNLAQGRAQQTFKTEKRLFDFNLSLKKTASDALRFSGTIIIDVPYASLWFTAVENKLKTALDIQMEIRNAARVLIWEHKESLEIVMEEEELRANKNKKYRIEIPFSIEKDLEKLQEGKNRLFVSLRNRTGGEEQKKILEFSL